MKRLVALTVLAAVAASLMLARSPEATKAQAQSVYFGFLVGTPRVAAVAIDLAAPDANGQRALRGYVCDGLGQPDGIAIWFRGAVDAQTGAGSLSLPSV